MKFSVAIPTYNSSKYLLDCLNSIKKIKNLNEIIINDDFSSENEYSKMLDITEQFYKKNKIKTSINRNNSNLGGFKNKYIAISKCTNEYVYQIDSDNLAGLNINKILNLNTFAMQATTFYLPSKVYLFKDNPFLSIFQNKYKVTLSSGDYEITKKEVSSAAANEENLFIDVKNRWVFNLGNFIVNRRNFLETMKTAFESTNIPLAADPIAMCFFWLHNDFSIKLVNNFYHFHRLRNDSYWHSAGNEAKISVEFFEKKIKNL